MLPETHNSQRHRSYCETGSGTYYYCKTIQKLDVATLTVSFKRQAKAAAFVGSIRYEVNKEVIVSSLKDGWWA